MGRLFEKILHAADSLSALRTSCHCLSSIIDEGRIDRASN